MPSPSHPPVRVPGGGCAGRPRRAGLAGPGSRPVVPVARSGSARLHRLRVTVRLERQIVGTGRYHKRKQLRAGRELDPAQVIAADARLTARARWLQARGAAGTRRLPARPKPARPEPGRPEPTRRTLARQKPGRPEPVRPEPVLPARPGLDCLPPARPARRELARRELARRTLVRPEPGRPAPPDGWPDSPSAGWRPAPAPTSARPAPTSPPTCSATSSRPATPPAPTPAAANPPPAATTTTPCPTTKAAAPANAISAHRANDNYTGRAAQPMTAGRRDRSR
jgi:hypothetical protein